VKGNGRKKNNEECWNNISGVNYQVAIWRDADIAVVDGHSPNEGHG
jgi:hypothetical protein